jgi:hypothetical protein
VWISCLTLLLRCHLGKNATAQEKYSEKKEDEGAIMGKMGK